MQRSVGKSVVETCWRKAFYGSVVEGRWREVLAKSCREVSEKSVLE